MSKPTSPPAKDEQFTYPATPRTQESVNFHQQQLTTPYRWLEQLATGRTQSWIKRQQQFANQKLATLDGTDFIKARLTELYNVVQISPPVMQSGKLFYLRNDGLQNQSSLYMQSTINAPPVKVVDASQLDPRGLRAITRFSVSPDAQYLAYAVSEVGSDWNSWYVKDLSSGELLTEVITGTKFGSVSWHSDNSGFYYSRYPRTADGFNDQLSVDVYFHKLKTSVSDDKRVNQHNYQPGVNPYPLVSTDGNYLLLQVQNGPSNNQFYVRPLIQPTAEFTALPLPAGRHRYLGSKGSYLYFYSSQKDDTGGVVRILQNSWNKVETVIPSQKLPLADVAVVGDELFVHYLQDAQSRLMIFNLTGEYQRELALPGFGAIEGVAHGSGSSQTFFKFSSYTQPGNIYLYEADKGRITLWHRSELPIDNDRYQIRQEFVETEPDIKVPVFLIRPSTTSDSQREPLLLHAYGGFGYTLTPHYQPDLMAWLEMGGSLAIANVRGGGAYGSVWHQSAVKHNKPKAIHDFLTVAEWLVDNNYVEADKLAAHGSGHGGMLVAAAMLKQPESFNVVLASSGVYDLLNYQRANANALSWQSEFGTSDNADEFNTLLSYSPLHNIKQGHCYPATLLSTGIHDQRVAPWHSYKFAAALQHAQNCDNPILIDIDNNAGHGTKTPIWLQIKQTHRQWSFAFNQLNVDWLKNSEQQ